MIRSVKTTNGAVIMNTQGILNKIRDWISAEYEKAERPGTEPFSLVSLAYCVSQACGRDDEKTIMPLLQDAVRSGQLGTYDVFTPEEVLRIIERTAFAVEAA